MPLSPNTEGTLTLVVQYLLHLKATRALEDLDGLDVAIDCLRDSAGLKAVTQASPVLEEVVAASGKAPERRKSPSELKEEGNELFKAKQYSKAAQKFTEAIVSSESEPDQTRAVYYANRAAARAALNTTEDSSRAIEDCQEAVRLYPTYHKAWYRLGQLYEAKGSTAEAHKAYGTAAAANPSAQLYQDAYRRTGDGEPQGGPQTAAAAGQGSSDAPGFPGFPGISGLSDLANLTPEKAQEMAAKNPFLKGLLDDPEVVALLQKPRTQELMQQIKENPMKAFQLMSDPEFGPVIMKLLQKVSTPQISSMLEMMGMPGMSGAPPPPPPGDMYV